MTISFGIEIIEKPWNKVPILNNSSSVFRDLIKKDTVTF